MSTISRVAVHAFSYELENFGPNIMTYVKNGNLPVTKFVTVIETDDGLRGEFAPHYMANAMTCAQVSQMAPMLIGRNAEHRGKIFEDLKNAFRHFDRAGIAAIDGSLWDLAGKKYNCSVAQLLGGYRDRIPAYASTFPGQNLEGGLDSIEAYADFAQHCAELGYPAFKIHGFWDGKPKSEIAIMKAVRERVGDSMRLMTDPASSLPTFLDAVEVGRACDDLQF
ncbi:MAG: enolase C-terminal domain-like protein, partial [Pseudomonadota bacterium]